jgi:tetratricopeptide (TPR) repeat protein
MDELAFRHDVYVDTAYAGLSYRRRRELHARAAEALLQRQAEGMPVDHGVLALHFQHGGRHAEAWNAARLAGESARAAYASAEACDAYALALEAGREAGVSGDELAVVAEALGDVGELAGRYQLAADAYRDAAAERRDDPVASARLMRKRGVLREREGRYGDALRWYGRALTALHGVLDDAAESERVALELAYAGVRHRQGRYHDSVRHAQRAAAAAEARGDQLSLGHALYLIDNAHTNLGDPAAGELAARAVEIFEAAGDDANLGNALTNLGVAAYYAGRWDEALALYRRSREAKTRAGDVVRAATGSNNEAEILLEQGHLDQAEALLREALRIWAAAGYQVGVALATENLGRVAARAGRLEEAAALLGDAHGRFEAIGARAFVVDVDARRAELLLLSGDHTAARTLARRTRERLAAEGGVQALLAVLLRVEGLALLDEGRAQEARATLEESAVVAGELRARYELGLSLAALAAAGRAAGVEDVEAAKESARILSGLGVLAGTLVAEP